MKLSGNKRTAKEGIEMSFIDWDGDGKITMADDMIDFMVYEDGQ